jgi:hypothetical protein
VTCGGDSGNRIFVLYWRCPLIRVSVIRGPLYLFTYEGGKGLDKLNSGTLHDLYSSSVTAVDPQRLRFAKATSHWLAPACSRR